jgi:hypothetical protein
MQVVLHPGVELVLQLDLARSRFLRKNLRPSFAPSSIGTALTFPRHCPGTGHLGGMIDLRSEKLSKQSQTRGNRDRDMQ